MRNFFFKSLLFLFAVFTYVGCVKKSTPLNQFTKLSNDSIQTLISNKEFVKALEQNKSLKNDSLKAKNYLQIAYNTLYTNDSFAFKTSNQLAYELNNTIKDTLGIAETHWNTGAYFSKQEKLDSAYFHFIKAFKLYESINHVNYSAKMLFNMAYIESRFGDYANAETKLFQAIYKYKTLNKHLSLYKSYKLLGTVYKSIEDYENSIIYHNNALESLKKVNGENYYREALLNDIALTRQLQGDYNKSITTFNEALKNQSLVTEKPLLYAKILDNLAYSKLLNKDTINVYKDLKKALIIRDSLQDIAGKITSKLHIAEYFILKKDTLKANNNAYYANNLAKQINNNEDLLKSLLLLAETDNKNTNKHLNEYIALVNKTEKQERLYKNKFARIHFETDYYIDKSEKLSMQKVYILVVGFILFTIFLMFYNYRAQSAKTKELSLKAKQQAANEEIYKLLLKQQSKLEEGRQKERHRISEELHDGVLGKIFGTRMGLGFLNINGTNETIKKHKYYIDELLNIEQEIRSISHDLKNEILLSKRDYISIISSLVENLTKVNNLEYEISIEDSSYWNESNDSIKINCYRIVQESVYNIIKHAKATHVKIDFDYQNKSLKLTITDNGIGLSKTKENKGIGLKNIKSRVTDINGIINITSTPNKGTTILIQIPYSN